MIVISIDPGRYKTGIAVVSSLQGDVSRRIVRTEEAPAYVASYKRDYPEAGIICGDSTSSKDFLKKLKEECVEDDVILVDEVNSSMDARKLYWRRHSKPWWLFFIPSTMIKPSRNIDDYAAIIIAKRYFTLLNLSNTRPVSKRRRRRKNNSK